MTYYFYTNVLRHAIINMETLVTFPIGQFGEICVFVQSQPLTFLIVCKIERNIYG